MSRISTCAALTALLALAAACAPTQPNTGASPPVAAPAHPVSAPSPAAPVASQLSPDAASLWVAANAYYAAVEMRRQGNYSYALELLDDALKRFPGYFLALRERGSLKGQMGRYVDGETDLNAALKLNPNSADVHSDLGLIAYHRGETAEALALFDTAITLNPDLEPAHYNRALVLRDLGRTDEANRETEWIIAFYQRFPDSAGAHSERGLRLEELGRHREAIAEYTAALTLKPLHPEDVYYWRGSDWQDLGERRKALADFNRAIKINRRFAWAHVNRANVHWDLGHLKSALRDYARAIALLPTDPKPRLDRAFLRLATDDYAGAIADAEHASDMLSASRDETPYVLLVLHLAYAHTGKPQAADLARRSAGVDLQRWPGPVLAYFMGRLDAAGVQGAVSAAPASETAGWRCEAAFYLGEEARAGHTFREALPLLEDAVAPACGTSAERKAAITILARKVHH